MVNQRPLDKKKKPSKRRMAEKRNGQKREKRERESAKRSGNGGNTAHFGQGWPVAPLGRTRSTSPCLHLGEGTSRSLPGNYHLPPAPLLEVAAASGPTSTHRRTQIPIRWGALGISINRVWKPSWPGIACSVPELHDATRAVSAPHDTSCATRDPYTYPLAPSQSLSLLAASQILSSPVSLVVVFFAVVNYHSIFRRQPSWKYFKLLVPSNVLCFLPLN